MELLTTQFSNLWVKLFHSVTLNLHMSWPALALQKWSNHEMCIARKMTFHDAVNGHDRKFQTHFLQFQEIQPYQLPNRHIIDHIFGSMTRRKCHLSCCDVDLPQWLQINDLTQNHKKFLRIFLLKNKKYKFNMQALLKKNTSWYKTKL